MRSACAICDRPVDLEAAPAERDEVICETCRKEVASATGAAPEPAAKAPAAPPPKEEPAAEAAPPSRRKAGKASFWIGEDEVGTAKAAAAAKPPDPVVPEKPRKRDVSDSSFDDLKLLASPAAQRAPRHVDDLMNLQAEYFGGSKQGPLLEPPDLRRAPAADGDVRLAPTMDLLAALAPPATTAAAPGPAADGGKKRNLVGVGAGVLVGVVLTVGIGQALRSGDAPAPRGSATAAATAAPKPVRTAEPEAVADEPKVKALTPGAKPGADEPPPAASAKEVAAAPPGAATPGTVAPGGSNPGAPPTGGAVTSPGAAAGAGSGPKEAKAAKEAPSAEPAPPAKPSEADALLAAQNAALNAPKGNAFSRSAAGAALTAAAGQATGCKKDGDPAGIAKVSVTFAPSGRVTNSQVIGGPYIGSAAGGCIARAFRSAQVPAFDGDPVTVQKAVDLR